MWVSWLSAKCIKYSYIRQECFLLAFDLRETLLLIHNGNELSCVMRHFILNKVIIYFFNTIFINFLQTTTAKITNLRRALSPSKKS